MSYLNQRRQFTTKPPYGTPINPADPICVGLRGAYILGEGGGSLAVNSVNAGVPGTVHQPQAAWASGREGPAFTGDGGTTKQYIDIGSGLPAALNLSGSLTVLALIRVASLAANQSLICDCDSAVNNCQFGLQIRTTGLLYNLWSAGGAAQVTGSTALTTNIWTSVGITRSGSSGNWSAGTWINGLSDASASGITANPDAQSGSSIGRLGEFAGSNYWNGKIEYLYIWARALSAIEILRIHQKPYSIFAIPRRRTNGAAAAVTRGLLMRRRREGQAA